METENQKGENEAPYHKYKCAIKNCTLCINRYLQILINKKQKGELDTSGQNCIYQHDHNANPKDCVWHN